MQSIVAQKPYWNGSFYGAGAPVQARRNQPQQEPTVSHIPTSKDQIRLGQVRFGKIENLTGPIPPNSLIILVPGIFSPAASMQPLADYLRPKGHTVHVLKSPFNIKAGSALASTNWLTHHIDQIRLEQASTRYISLLKKVLDVSLEKRLDFIHQAFSLKHDTLGKAAAQATLGLMLTPESSYEEESDFTHIVRRLREDRQHAGGALSDEDAHKRLSSLSMIAREQLHDDLHAVFMREPPGFKDTDFKAKDAALKKTIDHIMDQITPRVVLVGHSMGGFVSMLTLFEHMKDTAMVVGLSAPGENGTDKIPTSLKLLKLLPNGIQERGRKLLESLAPGFRHMLADSAESDKLKAKHQPFNTSIIAVATPDNYDGLVGEENARMNDSLPGRMNVVVTPKQANLAQMLSQTLHQANQTAINHLPLYGAFGGSLQAYEPYKGIAYHCGLTQFQDDYWHQQGDILRGIFEAPKNEEGKPDYQAGKPDFPEAITQIRRAIHPFNYNAARLHFLTILQDNLQDAKTEKSADEYQALLKAYQPLRKDLERISQEKQPIQNGVADKARQLLTILPASETETQD